MRRAAVALAALCALLIGAAPLSYQIGGDDQDTMQYVSGGGSPDTLTVVFEPSWLASSSHPDYPASADVTHKDDDGSMQFHGWLQWSYPDSVMKATSTFRTRGLSGVSLPSDRTPFVWFPLDSIPAGSTILSAKLCVTTTLPMSDAYTGDYVVAALDTCAADLAALKAAVAASPAYDGDYSIPNTSFNFANVDASTAWSPPIADRDDIHDYGIVSSRYTELDGNTSHTIDFTDALQVALDGGHPIGPLWVFWAYGNNSVMNMIGGISGAAASQPFVVVEYSTATHTQPWGGKPLAFVFSSDDFEDDNYDDWKPMFDFFDYKFTLFGAQSQLSASAGKMTGAELREMYDEGFEIGSHSRYHDGTNGIVWASTDSIADDVSRTWLADSLSAYGATVPESNIKGFAYPLHNFDIRSYNALISEGYTYARDGAAGTSAYGGWPGDESNNVAIGDTINVMLLGLSTEMPTINLAEPTVATKAQIKENFYDHIAWCMENGRTLINLYSHGTKSNPNYSSGVDAIEMFYLLQVIQEHGGIRVCTMSEAMRLRSKSGVPAPSTAPDAQAAGEDGDNGWRVVQ